MNKIERAETMLAEAAELAEALVSYGDGIGDADTTESILLATLARQSLTHSQILAEMLMR
jgi:hypothetical protein